MFRTLLIANRGEITCRIARTAHRMGMRTIAVYSEADRDALHVQSCDEAVCIGPADARESYLSIKNIIAAAKKTGAEAVHPGYGFLSENAKFAQAVIETNPDRALWGTDWPHPNLWQGMPDDGHLVDLIPRYAPDEAVRHKLLVDNPAALYGFGD